MVWRYQRVEDVKKDGTTDDDDNDTAEDEQQSSASSVRDKKNYSSSKKKREAKKKKEVISASNSDDDDDASEKSDDDDHGDDDLRDSSSDDDKMKKKRSNKKLHGKRKEKDISKSKNSDEEDDRKTDDGDETTPTKKRKRNDTNDLSDDEEEDDDNEAAAKSSSSKISKSNNDAKDDDDDNKNTSDDDKITVDKKKKSDESSVTAMDVDDDEKKKKSQKYDDDEKESVSNSPESVKTDEKQSNKEEDTTTLTSGDEYAIKSVLSRLPAAATPSAATTSSGYSDLRWITVRNDGKPESMLRLVGLKNLFAKQLPKMPRAYIARLVLDRRHTSLAILAKNDSAVVNSDDEIIGGICYRAFHDMKFAEIAFCAVNATHQVKGYGTKLMNLLKQTGARTGIEYFITYADNYAIGYFKKQGFTKNITMPRGRYFGLIKDYDGGTPMETYVHPSIDYTRVPQMIAAQRKYILSRLALTAKSLHVYPALPENFKPNIATTTSRSNLPAAQAMSIPGVAKAGWTMADLIQCTAGGSANGGRDEKKIALKTELLTMLHKIEEQQFAWPFREPVDPAEVPEYLDVISEPIDLKTMEKRIRHESHYKSKRMFYQDLVLMVRNCCQYNEDGSTYISCATSLEKYVNSLLPECVASAATTTQTANDAKGGTSAAATTATVTAGDTTTISKNSSDTNSISAVGSATSNK